MGVVGVGKSTLRDQLAQSLPQASIYEEWPEPMAKRVGHSMESLSDDSIQDIQSWIFTQLARKNALVSADPAELIIVDRTPLDTFAFYGPELWQERAQQMLNMPAPASGELIFLQGNPATLHARMDASRGYTVNTLAAQQSAFELLLDWLQEHHGYTVRQISTDGLTPRQTADHALEIVESTNYQPLDIHGVIQEIAHSRLT